MGRRNDTEEMIPIGLDETVQLESLAMGEVRTKFPAAMKAAVANLIDFDYPGKKKREIIIKVSLEPSEDRSYANVEVSVETKLPTPSPEPTKLYFVPAAGELVVSEENINQSKLAFK